MAATLLKWLLHGRLEPTPTALDALVTPERRVFVVDGEALGRYVPNADWMVGGRWGGVQHCAQRFVDVFSAMKAEVVVVWNADEEEVAIRLLSGLKG